MRHCLKLWNFPPKKLSNYYSNLEDTKGLRELGRLQIVCYSGALLLRVRLESNKKRNLQRHSAEVRGLRKV